MSKVASQEKWHALQRNGTGTHSELLSEAQRALAYTNKDVYMQWQPCVCVNDSYCPSTNDTLPKSQQGSYTTGRSEWQSRASSVLPVSVNTN